MLFCCVSLWFWFYDLYPVGFAAAGPKSKDKLSSAQNDLQDILDELKGSHVALAKSMRQSPLTPENLTKIQGDRLEISHNF